MARAMTKFCFVLKDAVKSPKIHKCKKGLVHWSDGTSREQDLPACGTRIDACALEIEWANGIDSMGHAGDPCGKCFPAETDPDVGFDTFVKAATIRCPKCRRGPGLTCTFPSGAEMRDKFHKARMNTARNL